MTPKRFWQLLRQDLYLLRRHGAFITIVVFTFLLSLIVFSIFKGALNSIQDVNLDAIPEVLLKRNVDPVYDKLGSVIPGAELSWRGVASGILYVRTLPVCLPLLLVVFTARVIANPIKNNTMREDLVRPISRLWLLAVRFSALSITSLGSLVFCLILGFIFGSFLGLESIQAEYIAAGWESPGFLALLTGVGLIWLSDMVIISIAILLSVLMQPAARVFLFFVIAVVLEALVRGALNLYAKMAGKKGEWATDITEWLPGQALDLWKQWPNKNWEIQPIIAIVALFAICIFLGGYRFRKMDIS